MRSLKLRHRLLLAGALIIVVQIVVGVIVVGATRNQLVDQIDDRLAFIASTATDNDSSSDNQPPPPSDANNDRRTPARPERPADVYEGVLDSSGMLVSSLPSTKQGVDLAPPSVGLEEAAAATSALITASSSGGDVRYRIIAAPSPSGGFLVNGLALDGVDATVARVRNLVIGMILAVIGALALAAWWAIRYGITPILSMTARAATVNSDDLSMRIEDIDEGTEAGLLGESINTMLDRIETSFDERLEAEHRLRRFLADASHELRTPIATIRGYAELYRKGGLEEEGELDDALRRTEQESQRMTRLITDMLNLARLDQEPKLETEILDMAVPVSDTITDARASNPARTIESSVCAGPLLVAANEDLLRQVLTNIVSNAIRHTGPEATVHVQLSIEGRSVRFEVTDEGPGMAPDVLAKATDRFYRADPSRSRQRGGSGLGLAIVDSVVTALGGTLDLQSSPDTGTTVTVHLPLAEQ